MTTTQLVVGVLLYCLGLVFVWALCRSAASGDSAIEQRASKAELDFVARLAAKRHAEIQARAK